jgi:nucleotide-binding universal stress UspA family protein
MEVAMVKRILVPLDRSDLAETIVPLVADLARGAGATVRLLHVAPVPENVRSAEGRIIAFSNQEMERLQAEGLDHLKGVAARRGLPAECVVRFGDDADEILREADACGADLIAVTTAGKSGLQRVAMGSVAEQVFRRAQVPVLLYHPSRVPD